MYIKQSYDEEFEHFMLDMKDKYPKSIFELNGISEEDLDHTKFAKKYFTKKNGHIKKYARVLKIFIFLDCKSNFVGELFHRHKTK